MRQKQQSMKGSSGTVPTDAPSTGPRVPFQQFHVTMRLQSAAHKLISRRKTKTNHIPPHPLAGPLVECTFIQSWRTLSLSWPVSLPLSHRNQSAFQHCNHLIIVQLIEGDATWLDGVCDELLRKIPVGLLSPDICRLSQALIRAMTQHKSLHAQAIVNDLFRRLLQEEDSTSNQKPIVTAVLYGIVTRHINDPRQAANLLELMRDRHAQSPTTCAKPMKSNLTSVLYCWAKSDLPLAPYKAHQILDNISKPNLQMYNIVLHAYYKYKLPEEAEQLLKQIEQNGINLNVKSYLVCILAWEHNAAHAVSVMERLCATPGIRPTTMCFLGVMQAIGLTDNPGPKVAAWMKQLKAYQLGLPADLKYHVDFHVGPSIYQVVMKAWAKSEQPEEVDEIMADMRSRGFTPNATCWTIRIHAWCKKNVDHAQALLQGLDKDNDLVQPTAAMCHFVLQGWIDKASPERGQAFFDWMCKHNIHVDAMSFKLALTGWSSSKSNSTAGKHVLLLLQRLEQHKSIQLDTSTYELVLRTLAYTHKQMVLKVLKRLEDMHGQKIHALSPKCYNIALSSASGVQEANEILSRMIAIKFRPTTQSFNFMLREWAKNSKLDAAIYAYSILNRMEAEFVEPDANTYNYILAPCMSVNCVRAAGIVQLILVRLENAYRSGDRCMQLSADLFLRVSGKTNGQQKKTSVSIVKSMASKVTDFPDKDFALSYYTFVLTVCSMSHDEETPSVAQVLWGNMINSDLRCFNLVLKTFAKHASPSKAEHLFQSVKAGYHWTPNETSFEYVIEAWARSREINAAQRAFHLLEQRKKQATPTAFANVLLACSMAPANDSGAKLHQYNLAIQTFQYLKDAGHTPSSLHYYRLLGCAIQLAPDSISRVGMATFIFRQCCQEGQVDQWILRRFWSIASKIVRKSLLDKEDDLVLLSELPNKWICHRLQT